MLTSTIQVIFVPRYWVGVPCQLSWYWFMTDRSGLTGVLLA